ncbi:hypothetical protein JZ751_000805 [Albula glossodonta]|uniref:Uncharacterized protein n=1 Tax=Albula glossodonta TaxID=121402 RepID=A0A8T2PXE7_9TELE|nr:hypothetical protein JZ751_000805 [Albula glossodonta]
MGAPAPLWSARNAERSPQNPAVTQFPCRDVFVSLKNPTRLLGPDLPEGAPSHSKAMIIPTKTPPATRNSTRHYAASRSTNTHSYRCRSQETCALAHAVAERHISFGLCQTSTEPCLEGARARGKPAAARPKRNLPHGSVDASLGGRSIAGTGLHLYTSPPPTVQLEESSGGGRERECFFARWSPDLRLKGSCRSRPGGFPEEKGSPLYLFPPDPAFLNTHLMEE